MKLLKMNKGKIIITLLLLTSLIGYTEWGNQQSMFIFQMEYALFFGNKGNVANFSHPLIFIPLIGQLILLVTIFVKQPKKNVVIIGASAIFILLFIYFLVGLLTQNLAIIGSTLPYLIVYIYTIIFFKQNN